MQIWNGHDKYCWRYRADTILSTDGQTDGQGETSIPPFNFVEAVGIKIRKICKISCLLNSACGNTGVGNLTAYSCWCFRNICPMYTNTQTGDKSNRSDSWPFKQVHLLPWYEITWEMKSRSCHWCQICLVIPYHIIGLKSTPVQAMAFFFHQSNTLTNAGLFYQLDLGTNFGEIWNKLNILVEENLFECDVCKMASILRTTNLSALTAMIWDYMGNDIKARWYWCQIHAVFHTLNS